MSDVSKYKVDREEWWPVLSVERWSGRSSDESEVFVIPDVLVQKYWEAQGLMHEAAQAISEQVGLDDEYRTPRERSRLIGLRDV